MNIYKNQTSKPLTQFVKDLHNSAASRGFKIHNTDKMDMAGVFNAHNIDTPETFDLHMMQLCKPEKGSKSMIKNLERSVLIPKFVIAYTEQKQTQIRFLHYSEESVARLIDDAEFPKALVASCKSIIEIIEDALDARLAEAC
jgi:uncharacterized protein (DUF302 family)